VQSVAKAAQANKKNPGEVFVSPGSAILLLLPVILSGAEGGGFNTCSSY
jgi:hypothetical protein